MNSRAAALALAGMVLLAGCAPLPPLHPGGAGEGAGTAGAAGSGSPGASAGTATGPAAPADPSPSSPSASEPGDPVAGKAAEPLPQPTAGPAALELLQQALLAEGHGDYAQAAALLERALAIEPGNANLWHELALVHHLAGSHDQAETFALRSIDLAGSNTALQRRNWELVAIVREYRGDLDGMWQALQHAQALQPSAP